jgi:hypothetical protein
MGPTIMGPTIMGPTILGLIILGPTIMGPTIMGLIILALTVPVRPIQAPAGARGMIPALASAMTAETMAFLAGTAATTMPRRRPTR